MSSLSLFLLLFPGCAGTPPPEAPIAAPRSAASPHDLLREARRQERMGGDYWQRDYAKALQHYTRFEELAGEALELAPDNPVAQTMLPLATVKMSDAKWRLGQREDALAGYDRAWERLRAVPETRSDWGAAATGLVVARVVVGERYLLEGDLEAAEDSFRMGLDVATEWTRRAPRDPRALRKVLWTSHKTADACILRGDYLLADSHLLHARQTLASGVDLSGRTLFYSNETAEVGVLQALQGLAALRAAGDRTFPRADAYQDLADRSLSFQDWAIAHAYFTRVIETRASVLEEADRDSRERQVQAHHRLSVVNKMLNRLDDFVSHARIAQELAGELLGEAWTQSLAQDAASGHLVLGMHVEEAGDADSGRSHYERALDLLRELNRRGFHDPFVMELRRVLASKGYEL